MYTVRQRYSTRVRPTRSLSDTVVSASAVAVVSVVAIALGACNTVRVEPMDDSVVKGVRENIASGGRTNVDVLWVIDNSKSMCEEQANLADNFRIFVEGIAELDAAIRMAVVTTDIEDPTHSGKFQANPARDFDSCREADPTSGVLCQTDDDCSAAGCLCGLPHLRRCASDDDCDVAGTEKCISSGGSSVVRFCSPTCSDQGDCRTALTDEASNAFWCSNPPENPERRHCLLRMCPNGDIDCGGDRCVPSGIEGDEASSYCRLFENRNIQCQPGQATCPLGLTCRDNRTCPPYADCPAPTCDCPRDLGKSMRFDAGNADEAQIEAAVRNFRCLATVGTDGADIERGLGAVRFALTGKVIEEDHPDFFREEAHLVIILLSDEDDCTGDEVFASGGGLQCGKRGIKECVWCKDALESVTSLADFVRTRKKAPWQVAVAAIVGDATAEAVPFNTDPIPACASQQGVAFSSDRYTSFVKEFGKLGVFESICADSFEGPLERLANLVISLQDRFCLEAPVRRCTHDEMCAPGTRCGFYWGASGQCIKEGEFVGYTCTSDADCARASVEGATCDDRRFCQDVEGDPADLQVQIAREGASGLDVLDAQQWSFVPNSTFGCLQFTPEASPGPEDAVEIRYLSTVFQ